MSEAIRVEGMQRFVRGVERMNLVLVLAALALTHLFAGFGPFFYGVLAGGSLGVLNFRVLTWLGGRLLRASKRSTGLYAFLFLTKLAVLMALVWGVLHYLAVDALGFLVGISTLLPALFVMGLRASLAPAAESTEQSL